MPASSPPSPRKRLDGSSSRLPAIVVNPSHGADQDTYEPAPDPSARRLSDTERFASFLEAMASAMRDGVQRRGPTTPAADGAPHQSASNGLGAPQPATGYGYEQDDGAEMLPSAFLYHLMRTLRNLNHFVFITPTQRGLFFIVHVPRKVLVVILFALFLMFASVYRLPEVWEILFGIFGII